MLWVWVCVAIFEKQKKEKEREMLSVLAASSGCRLLCFGCCYIFWTRFNFSSGVKQVKAVVVVILQNPREKKGKKQRKEKKRRCHAGCGLFGSGARTHLSKGQRL